MNVKNYVLTMIAIFFFTDFAILLNIPFLRQILGFLFLTILPGVLILQILKLNKIEYMVKFVLAVGLSIFFLMFFGLFMNLLYPTLGISKPLSTWSLIISINIALMMLCVLGYKVNRELPSLTRTLVRIKEILSPPALFLILLPIISIFGIYMVKFYGNNIFLLSLIILISLVVVLATFDIIPKKFYPLAVIMIALALVFMMPLITFYISGDTAKECYFYTLVKESSYWNPTIGAGLNALLGITILPVIYSNLLNINEIVLFRILYPLLYSFVPLSLYLAYQKQMNAKTAFLSIFFFMSLDVFYRLPEGACRETLAELFLALIILLMAEKIIGRAKRTTLLIIFSFSIVVVHYGVSYFYMFYLLGFISVSFIVDKGYISDFWRFLYKKPWVIVGKQIKSVESSRTITKSFVLLYIVLLISWYLYVSSSSNFEQFVHIFNHIYDSIFTDLLDPSTRETATLAAIGLGQRATSFSHVIYRYIWHITQLFIIVGVFSLIIKRREMNFTYEYIIWSFISCILLAMCIVLPYFTQHFQIYRIYHITLFFLAPCCIVGGQNIFRGISKLLAKVSKRLRKKKKNRFTSASFLLIILIPYFLFNIGFIFYFTDDLPPPTPLTCKKTVDAAGLKDYISAKWLSGHRNEQSVIYAGWTSRVYSAPYPLLPPVHVLHPNQDREKNAFFYLRCDNIKEKKIIKGRISGRGLYNFTSYPSYNIRELQLSQNNKIYSNGGSEIYGAL